MIKFFNPIKKVKDYRIEHGDAFHKLRLSSTYFLPPDRKFEKWMFSVGLKVRKDLTLIQRAHMIIAEKHSKDDIARMARYEFIGDENSLFELRKIGGIDFTYEKITILKDRIAGVMGNCYLIDIPNETHQMAFKLIYGEEDDE
jgi:hypothetical protein